MIDQTMNLPKGVRAGEESSGTASVAKRPSTFPPLVLAFTWWVCSPRRLAGNDGWVFDRRGHTLVCEDVTVKSRCDRWPVAERNRTVSGHVSSEHVYRSCDRMRMFVLSDIFL